MNSLTFGLNRVAVVAVVAALTACVWGLAGCTMGQMELSGAATGTATGASSGSTLRGGVHGGRQPVIGATLQLYAAGAPAMPVSGNSTGGYGQGAVALIPAGSMSVGSTNNYSPGGASGCSYVAGNPNGCTALPQTDATGSFTITGDYTCPAAASQVYIVATGGDPGTGSSNDALALMAGLGTCPASGTLAATIPFVTVNEVTTVATVWALQQFMGAPTGVAANDYASQGGATTGVAVNVGAPSGPVGGYGASGVQTSVIGQQNAFSMINSLTDISVGSSGSGSAGTAKNAWATPWAAKINTIANVLAACVNAPTVNCAPLFSNATPSGATAAADTIQAAYYMARNPTNNVSTLYTLGAGTPPYSGLGTAPNDWGVFVGLSPTFAAGGPAVASSFGGAIDEYGHVWSSNYNTSTSGTAFSAPFVSEIATDGTVLGGPFGNPAAAAAGGAFATANGFMVSGGFSTTGCNTTNANTLVVASNGPRAMTIDLSGVVWTNDPDNATICTSTSVHPLMRVTGSTGYSPTSSGWVAPSLTNAVVENGSTYTGLVTDASNNVYIANSSTTSGKQQEFVNGGATYVAGASLESSNPGWDAVDTNTHNGGPFLWTVGYKNCPSQQGQIFQQPLSALTATASVNTYQNSACTSSNGTTGTVTNINAAMQNPFGIAVDANNNLWVTNSVTNNSVSFLAAGATGVLGTGADTSVSTPSGFAGLANPFSVAVDGSNQAWIASDGSSQPYYVAVLTATLGNPITIGMAPQLTGSGNAGLGFTFTSSSLPFPKAPKTISVDPSGNVWFFNNNTSSVLNWVSVLVGQATPVITPLALQVKANKIGQLP